LPQAEAQVTAADAENLDLLHFFELSKAERGKPKNEKLYDIHRKNAALSLSKLQADINSMEREACKRVVHGTNYGMGAKKQQAVLLKELTTPDGKPLWVPLNEVERRRNNYLASDPSILQRQARIREDLFKTRRMINPYGRVIIFHEIINDPDVLYLFGRRDYDLVFQSAYSWFPQSTIADAINTSIAPLNDALKKEGLGRVAAQIHDELLMEIRDDFDSIRAAVSLSGSIMSRPILIRGYSLQIFPDIKLGFDWGSLQTCELDDQVEELYAKVRG
jgi:DNA polymerase I-like protein with 3'-5' exonuclease and polymerase domains